MLLIEPIFHTHIHTPHTHTQYSHSRTHIHSLEELSQLLSTAVRPMVRVGGCGKTWSH